MEWNKRSYFLILDLSDGFPWKGWLNVVDQEEGFEQLDRFHLSNVMPNRIFTSSLITEVAPRRTVYSYVAGCPVCTYNAIYDNVPGLRRAFFTTSIDRFSLPRCSRLPLSGPAPWSVDWIPPG